jgi:hypothetical protein
MEQYYIVFLVILITTSCGQKHETANPESQVFIAERETFFNSLKNPDEATQLVPGLSGFDSALLNEAKNYHRYGTSKVMAAANLGIYAADLNYCILFKQTTKTREYFDAVYELSKILQTEKSTLEFLMKRYQKNLAQNDSVKLIVQKLVDKSTLGLQGTDQERLAGIAMAGYQIENLHLAVSNLELFPETLTEDQLRSKNLLLNFIIDQQGKFEIIYNFIRANSDPLDPERNPNYPFFDNAIRELIGVYSNVTMNDPRIKELSEKVNAIRTKIVMHYNY